MRRHTSTVEYVASRVYPTYQVVTAELTLATAVGRQRILQLFHPTSSARTFELDRKSVV